MPGAMVHGLVWGHQDLKHVHGDDYSLNDLDEGMAPSISILEDAAALEVKLSEAGAETVPSPALAAVPTLSKRESVSMLSVPGGGGAAVAAAAPRTGTFVSSAMIYITSCFGCSCLTMPWAWARSGWALAIGLLLATAAITQWGANILLDCAVRVAGDPGGGVSIKQIAAVASPKLTALPEVHELRWSMIRSVLIDGFR